MGELTYFDGATVSVAVDETADAVVVGTGAGGATAARALAEAGLRVVMLEEGPYITGVHMNGKPLPMFDLLYRNRGLTGTLGTPVIPVPLGRAVGGTTVINSGTCFRTPDNVLVRWEQEFGFEGATQLGGFYDEVERDLDIKPVPDHLYGEHARRFEAAAQSLGYRGRRIPRNERNCQATGVCALGCPQDAKQAMSVSYVPRALRAGARLFCRARVDRVRFEGIVATGIEGHFLSASGAVGAPFRILAKLVVVAAGAMHSPVLLLRSALPVKLPRLGRNLHLHPATRVLAKYPDPIFGWAEVPQSYNVDEFMDEGIFIQGQFVSPPIQAPNVPGIGREHVERLRGFDRMASFGALISDTTEGRVRRNGLATYAMNQRDAETLRRAIALTAEIFLTAGAIEVYTGVASQPIVRTRADLERLRALPIKAANIEMMAFHPMGTCAVGKQSSRGVTDAYGRVFGTRNLVVADTSLFPTSNRINPQLTVMAISLRNARVWANTLV